MACTTKTNDINTKFKLRLYDSFHPKDILFEVVHFRVNFWVGHIYCLCDSIMQTWVSAYIVIQFIVRCYRVTGKYSSAISSSITYLYKGAAKVTDTL